MDNWSNEVKLIASAGFLLLIWLIRFLVVRLLNRATDELTTRALWRQVINVLTTMSALFLLIRIWFEWFQSFVTLLSVIAAALVIVNKEILLNLFSYSIIIWRGLFKIGDRIQIASTTGDVTRLGIMYLSIVESSGDKFDRSSGRVVRIPNKEVIDKHIVNLSRGQGMMWQEVSVSMPLAANWRKAQETLQGILADLNHELTVQNLASINNNDEDRMMDLTRKPEVFFRVDGEKYVFTCRYLSHCEDQRVKLSNFWKAVLTKVDEEDDLFLLKPENAD